MCGDIESNEHFLMICPRYSQIRGDLLNALRDFIIPASPIKAQLLLYGDCELSVEDNISLFKVVICGKYKNLNKITKIEHISLKFQRLLIFVILHSLQCKIEGHAV